jgi:hypothetical protein
VRVLWHPDAERELNDLPKRERAAMLSATEKLEAEGITLGFPHTSKVQGVEDVRELRPRRGASPWRGLYRRVGDALVIGSISPEAKVDRRGFEAAVVAARERLDGIEED